MKKFAALLFLFLSLTAFAQVFTQSNLPIVLLTTDGGQEIPDDPKIPGSMKIVYRGEGQTTYLSDQDTPGYLNYDGRMEIEVRGSSSQALPKKQYSFTTMLPDDSDDMDVSLLGMPEESDWIFNGLAFDPSLIRDYLSYNLARQLGDYATRTQYCEVMLNGDYIGLYLLQEKIKSDANRVDVVKIAASNNALPNLSGGYITKTDKTTGGDPVAWTMTSSLEGDSADFIHELPKPDDVTAQQDAYIHTLFNQLQSTALANNTSFINGYPAVIDVPSFIDYMIIAELASNADSYEFSTYYHKDRNGKLRAGPVWDYNLTYGNDLFMWGLDRSHYNVWQFDNGDNQGAAFWKNLFNNPTYKCYFAKRWTQLTQTGGTLNGQTLYTFIDATLSKIAPAAFREHQKWGTVPNLTLEIQDMKDWLESRLAWISSQMPSTVPCNNVTLPSLVIDRIWYNPDVNSNFTNSNDQEFISVKNTGVATVDLTGIYFRGTGFVYQFQPNETLAAGATVFLASKPAVFQNRFGFAAYGQFTRNLSNIDKDLVLADGFGNVIDRVHYYNTSPWADANGNGFFLKLINEGWDNALASSWEAVNANTLGLEAEAPLSASVYPNPASLVVTVRAARRIDTIEIFDLQGRVVRKADGNAEEMAVSVSGLQSGVYLVKVTSGGKSAVIRLAKQ